MNKIGEIAPVISVITPALNEEKLLPRFLLQFTPELKSRFKIEIIISDGGSTDKTLEIAASADKIIIAKKGEKQNIPIGRNAGARAAEGKYLYFMNADTRISDIENFFYSTLTFLENNNPAALTMPVRIFPEEETLFDKTFHFIYNNYVRFLNKLKLGMGRGECQIIRKEIFDKLNGYNENMFAGEDFDLYKRVRKFGSIKYINNVLIYESPRRFRKFGYRRVVWDWTKNSLSVVFKNKSASSVWEQVR